MATFTKHLLLHRIKVWRTLEVPSMQTGYIPGLDGLRTLAVGSVFFCHAFPSLVSQSVGVDMFFALSGFLITRGLIAQLDSAGRVALGAFYLRRAYRLAPALLVMVAVTFGIALAMHAALPSGRWLRPDAIAGISAVTYTMNWFRAFDLGSVRWYGHAWSLAVEEQFYLAWPLLLAATYRRGWALRCALALAVGSLALRLGLHHFGASWNRIYNGFDTRLDGLLIGCALALAKPANLAGLLGRVWGLPACAILLTCIFLPWKALHTATFTIVATATACLILPLWADKAPRLRAALEVRPMRYLGRISYGLYLWHWPALLILADLGFARETVGNAALAGGGAILCAAASYHWVEQPVLQGHHAFLSTKENHREAGAHDSSVHDMPNVPNVPL